MSEKKKISQMIDVKLLQSIQDNCSKAMGIGAVTVDYRGNPITKYSGFTEHCMKVREVQGFSEMCAQCDAHGGLHAAITGQPYIYRCHAGLVDFAVPLIVNGTYVGAVLGGQVRMSDEEEHQLDYILPQEESNWRKHPEIVELYEQMEPVSYEKVAATVHILRDIIVSMTEREQGGQVRDTLAEKDKELSEERAVRSELELAIRKQEAEAVGRNLEARYFYYVMNIISRLAYEEKAARTEQVAYDFADVIRYTTGRKRKISTLGEELDYIAALLRIQKAWVGDKLDFIISVPTGYWGIPCPFMLLQPIVDKMLDEFVGEHLNPVKLEFYGEEKADCFQLQIHCDNCSQTIGEWEQLLKTSNEDGEYSIHTANSSLRTAFGEEYGIRVSKREGGQTGLIVRIQLPLEKRGA